MKLNKRWVKLHSCPAVILALAISPLVGQSPVPPADGSAAVWAPVVQQDCDATKLDSYVVRSVQLNHPLKFLHSIQAQLDRVAPKLLVKPGDKFSSVDANTDRKTLENEFPIPSHLNSPIALRIATAIVANCAEDKLDVDFFILSSQFLPSAGGTIESRRKEASTPQDLLHAVENGTSHPVPAAPVNGSQAASAAPKGPTWQLTPTAGYNPSEHLFGGGRLRILTPVGGSFPIQSLNLEGCGSGSFHDVSGSVQGSPDAPGPFSSLDWQLNFHSQSLPTGSTSLSHNSLIGQFAVATKPVTSAALLFRLGGQLEGGNMQSGFPTANFAPGTIAGAGYGAVKTYGGLTFGTKHQIFSTSYGLELGGTSVQPGLDWRKQIGDVTWDLWFPLGDHRPLQIETRFTSGGLQTSQGAVIPIGERFFGGNVQENFIPGDNWDFRANPVIRGIPAQGFHNTPAGVGADRFTSFNLTASPVVLHSALLPKEISDDTDFKKRLQDGWDHVQANVALAYTVKDPHALAMAKTLPAVQAALDSLLAAVTADKPVSGSPSAEWTACDVALIRARGRVKSTSDAIGKAGKLTEATYGNLLDLTSDQGGNKLLPLILDSCTVKLNTAVNDPAIAEAGRRVTTVLVELESQHSQISVQHPSALAQRDLVYPKRVLDTILRDLNLWSVSPVGIFDVAQIGSNGDSRGGLRYAAGGGVRVMLVSHASFTMAYARNLHRLPGEGSGALFFSIGVTELLR